jgi:hypothetical protein
MPIRLKKSGVSAPASPSITFTNQEDVMTLARLLAEHRGKQTDRDYFQSLIYCCLIYDHYSVAYRTSQGGNWGIGRSWRELGDSPEVQAAYAKILPWSDVSLIRDIDLHLPIASASPLFPGTAPQGVAGGQYAIGALSSSQFAEIAWKVRCNLLHGSWDPCNATISTIISKVGRVFRTLVWEMVSQTQR